MVLETKPDLIIVTTKDSMHHEFIIKGLNMDCDVLTEKPLTIDEDKCQAILDAERKSDKKLIKKKKWLQRRRELHSWFKRAEAVGIAPMPARRPTKGQRLAWEESIIQAEGL